MDLNLSVLQEPRGVMRIFHFVFAIVSFATTVDFAGQLTLSCGNSKVDLGIDYPFALDFQKTLQTAAENCTTSIVGSFASDARFYVCTGVLSMLYALTILIVYTKFDQLYKTNENVPLADFILSVVLAIFWLSSSAAWANGLTGLKHITSNVTWKPDTCTTAGCTVSSMSFSSLNISIVIGFLNFFLWAANLWFLYKETKWFQKPVPTPEA